MPEQDRVICHLHFAQGCTTFGQGGCKASGMMYEHERWSIKHSCAYRLRPASKAQGESLNLAGVFSAAKSPLEGLCFMYSSQSEAGCCIHGG